MSVEALQLKLNDLEQLLATQQARQAEEARKVDAQIRELSNKVTEYEKQKDTFANTVDVSSADSFVRRAEWTIDVADRKLEALKMGEALWSPEFKLVGIAGMQLEFFPKGREATTIDGFCSLFLWCPSGTKIKYQLFVGKHLRAPDEDEYDGRMGHGHSNFCMLQPELGKDKDGNSVITVGVDILFVDCQPGKTHSGMVVRTVTPEAMVAREAEILRNMSVSRVEWRIAGILKRMESLPQGHPLVSKPFSAGGVRNVFLEFYPCGNQNTTKDGHCGLYVRCPVGISVVITLFVGSFRKGPIKTSFDNQSGKGLPDFCPVIAEIDREADSIVVGIEIQNEPATALQLETTSLGQLLGDTMAKQ